MYGPVDELRVIENILRELRKDRARVQKSEQVEELRKQIELMQMQLEELRAANALLKVQLKALEEKQKHLTQRSIDKKVLENLKNRRREEYYIEMMKTVYKESDDATILREAKSVNR